MMWACTSAAARACASARAGWRQAEVVSYDTDELFFTVGVRKLF